MPFLVPLHDEEPMQNGASAIYVYACAVGNKGFMEIMAHARVLNPAEFGFAILLHDEEVVPAVLFLSLFKRKTFIFILKYRSLCVKMN